MARKIYYKVLDRRALTSCTTHLKYTEKQWTTPTISGSKLAVFATLQDAKEFTHSNTIIYKCYVKNPIKPYKYRSGLSNSYHIYWDVVAAARKRKKNITAALDKAGYYYAWPNNTILCNAVMLLKPIL